MIHGQWSGKSPDLFILPNQTGYCMFYCIYFTCDSFMGLCWVDISALQRLGKGWEERGGKGGCKRKERKGSYNLREHWY